MHLLKHDSNILYYHACINIGRLYLCMHIYVPTYICVQYMLLGTFAIQVTNLEMDVIHICSYRKLMTYGIAQLKLDTCFGLHMIVHT